MIEPIGLKEKAENFLLGLKLLYIGNMLEYFN